jgi:hypothetical protein
VLTIPHPCIGYQPAETINVVWFRYQEPEEGLFGEVERVVLASRERESRKRRYCKCDVMDGLGWLKESVESQLGTM